MSDTHCHHGVVCMLVFTHMMHSYAYTQSVSLIGTDRSCVKYHNTSTAEGQLTNSNCSRCRGWLLRGSHGMEVLGKLVMQQQLRSSATTLCYVWRSRVERMCCRPPRLGHG